MSRSNSKQLNHMVSPHQEKKQWALMGYLADVKYKNYFVEIRIVNEGNKYGIIKYKIWIFFKRKLLNQIDECISSIIGSYNISVNSIFKAVDDDSVIISEFWAAAFVPLHAVLVFLCSSPCIFYASLFFSAEHSFL